MMQDFILWAIGTIISLGAAITGWVFKMVFQSIRDVEKNTSDLAEKLSVHEVYVEKTFANKVDVKEMSREILAAIGRLDEKLDKKVDK